MASSKDDFLSTKRRRAAAIWLTTGLSLTIAALTLIPLNVPGGVAGSDKIHHVLAFTALTLPCAALYPRALLKVMLAAALYGGTIEFMQPFVGRSGELADFVADLSGIGLGAMLGLLFHLALGVRISLRPLKI